MIKTVTATRYVTPLREGDSLPAIVEADDGQLYVRLAVLSPKLDVTMLQAHLDLIPRICAGGADAGPLGQLSQAERFHWLVAPRSTIIQVSPVHCGLCDDPQAALDNLFAKMVR